MPFKGGARSGAKQDNKTSAPLFCLPKSSWRASKRTESGLLAGQFCSVSADENEQHPFPQEATELAVFTDKTNLGNVEVVRDQLTTFAPLPEGRRVRDDHGLALARVNIPTLTIVPAPSFQICRHPLTNTVPTLSTSHEIQSNYMKTSFICQP